MKRLILTAIAAASVLAPMAAAGAADAQGYYGRDRDYSYRDRDRDGRPDDSRYDRYDNRRGERWDDRRYNGYTYNNRWYYGPPPQAYYGNPGLHLGWRNWQRGQRLPSYYNSNTYVIRDYSRYGLQRPPRGYEWRQVGNDYLLINLASGLIAQALRH